MQTMTILVGLPASGKSTYAYKLVENGAGWYRVNWDSLRWYDTLGNPKAYTFNRQNEDQVKRMAEESADMAVRLMQNLVIDNTNLTDAAQNYWKEFARRRGMHVETVEFDTPLDECLRRNDLRTGWKRVPRAVIERMALNSGRVEWPHSRIVVVDMDGTLADLSHRHKFIRGICPAPDCINGVCGCSPFDNPTDCAVCKGTGKQKKDWDSFFKTVSEDKPIKPVIEWVKSLDDHGYYVCIVSGRPLDKAGNATIDWLNQHKVPFDRIFMRNGGDKRDDVIVKQEILDKMPKGMIQFAIDDRPRVIRMWRANGVKCYDVGNGVEF